jgi:hypothetical protein
MTQTDDIVVDTMDVRQEWLPEFDAETINASRDNCSLLNDALDIRGRRPRQLATVLAQRVAIARAVNSFASAEAVA